MNRRQFLKRFGLMVLVVPFLGVLPAKSDQAESILITGTENYDGEYIVMPDSFPYSGYWVKHEGVIKFR